MSFIQKNNAYSLGIKSGLPFLVVIIPFGLLFGVVASESGLSLLQSMAMTTLVVAGASQFAAIQLLSDNAPAWVAIATGLTINLRMLMYSASLVTHVGAAPLWQRALLAYSMVDQIYASAIQHYEDNPRISVADKVAYYLGAATPIMPMWLASCLFGAMAGTKIPEHYALDFAVPITFIATVGPSLRTHPHIAAALAGVIVALLFAWLPFNLGLMLGAISGMATGASLEYWLESKHEHA
jgi:predicted branched-subunit amino acid permease